jgi:hypothetical protein
MTTRMQFDLSDAYNRIVDTWHPVFASASPLSMPIAACAYPVNMGEHTIASIRDDAQLEDYHLRWQMAIGPAGEYHLYCNWQGRTWHNEGDRLVFIENAVGWVDWLGSDGADRLDVQVAFGRPSFANNVASMTVDFYVVETDTEGTVLRETHRSFQIHADGRRDALF